MGTQTRNPRNREGIEREHKDPGRKNCQYIPTLLLGFPVWGSLFGVPCLGFP